MEGRVRSDQDPDLTLVSGSRSMCKGTSAFKLKFGREMGTHPRSSVPMFGLGTPAPRVRGPKNGVPGSMQPKPWFAWVWMLQQALQRAGALQRAEVVWNLKQVLKIHQAEPGTLAGFP